MSAYPNLKYFHAYDCELKVVPDISGLKHLRQFTIKNDDGDGALREIPDVYGLLDLEKFIIEGHPKLYIYPQDMVITVRTADHGDLTQPQYGYVGVVNICDKHAGGTECTDLALALDTKHIPEEELDDDEESEDDEVRRTDAKVVCNKGFEPHSYTKKHRHLPLTKCTKCKKGSYKEGIGNYECEECPAGSFCPKGSKKAEYCQVGKWSDAGADHDDKGPYHDHRNAAQDQNGCFWCEAGMHCEKGDRSQCAAGSYCEARQPTKFCPQDQWSETGSTGIEGCKRGLCQLPNNEPTFCTNGVMCADRNCTSGTCDESFGDEARCTKCDPNYYLLNYLCHPCNMQNANGSVVITVPKTVDDDGHGNLWIGKSNDGSGVDMSRCPKLQEAYFQDNDFKTPPDVSHNTKLEVLDLSQNPLQSPPEVKNLAHLKELDLAYTQIKAPPDLTGSVSESLEILYLDNNEQLTALPYLRNVNVSDGPWKVLDFSRNERLIAFPAADKKSGRGKNPAASPRFHDSINITTNHLLGRVLWDKKEKVFKCNRNHGPVSEKHLKNRPEFPTGLIVCCQHEYQQASYHEIHGAACTDGNPHVTVV